MRSYHTAELLGKIQLHLYRRFVLYINVFRLSLLPGRPAQGGDEKTFPQVFAETTMFGKADFRPHHSAELLGKM